MISGICSETNVYVSPKYADKHKKYKCPECNKEIVLCKGEIIKPYFRHKSDTEPCKYYDKPSESQMHKDSKELVRYWLQNNYCMKIKRKCIFCREDEMFEIPEIDEKSQIEVEYRFDFNGLKIADVCYLDEDDIVCIFEIFHTHKTDATKRPGIWFEFIAESIIEHNPSGSDVYLECIRKEKCECCKEKELKKEQQRLGATKILYGWLEQKRIAPFDYFNECYIYYKTELLENHYFNIRIYENFEDEVDIVTNNSVRYNIRLCFQDETPDFQDYEREDIGLGIIGIYFVDVEWVYKQTNIPEYIKTVHYMDWYKKWYRRECMGKCKDMLNCFWNLPFRVKSFDYGKKIISIDNWCDIETNSEYIPCLFCNQYNTPLAVMKTNVHTLLCKSCDIETYNENKIYFDVSYSKKDIFKDMGGLWDPVKKKWYCDKYCLNIAEIKAKFTVF